MKCPFCGSDASTELVKGEFVNGLRFYECPCCGRFELYDTESQQYYQLKNETSSYLYYKYNPAFRMNDNPYYAFLGNKYDWDNVVVKNEYGKCVSCDEILAFYPKTLSEKITLILLGIAKRSKFLGDSVLFSLSELLSAFFVKRYDNDNNSLNDFQIKQQYAYMLAYLKDNKYILQNNVSGGFTIELTPVGWSRVDELQKSISNTSKNVFVAMSFADNMKETRETIKKAITENGFVPRIMDEIEHNHQIVPEMLYEIREARFVIAELTGQNNGAYFEAGYALGYGKEVIQVCNKEEFGKEGHFDVKQINTVMWENQDDLFTRLNARIKATIL